MALVVFECPSALVAGVADADCGREFGPVSFGGGVIIDRKPEPWPSPSQFMLRGHVRPLSTTIWSCSDAIFPSVNEDRSGEAFHPVVPVAPAVGHQRPLSSEWDPHGRWMRSRRCGATPVWAFAMMGRHRA